MKIGIFDSGLGGLIITHALIEHMPQYDYIYLAIPPEYLMAVEAIGLYTNLPASVWIIFLSKIVSW